MNRRILISDKELLELLSVECNTFTDIAKIAGVSRERIRQLWNRKFKKILGTRKTGHQRTKVCTRKQNAVLKASLVPVGHAARAAEYAKAAGLSVAPFISYNKVGRPKASGRKLWINGSLVYVRFVASVSKMSKHTVSAMYYRVVVYRRFGAKFLAVILPETCLVIPFQELYIGQSIYIRTDRDYVTYPETYPRSNYKYGDWWQYEQAWDQIPAE